MNEDINRVLREAIEQAGLPDKIGKACLICQGNIILDENGEFLYSPFYCEDCIEDMRNKGLSPHDYAKQVHNVDLHNI